MIQRHKIGEGKMNYTLKNERIEAYNQSDKYVFPKYLDAMLKTCLNSYLSFLTK